jgi:CRISPR/Cas system CSM-associated protein Csm4 (group 5 of RAMP superfamily)
MFSEGSVFPGLKKGDMVDVSPDGYEKIYGHKVYRYGLAFSLPCKLSNEN